MKRLICFFALFLFTTQNALAAGFQIPEMGVKAMGMAHAYTAVADDPTANWFNPAGLAFQDGHSATVGGVLVMPAVDFTENAANISPGVTTSSISDKIIAVPHAYLTGTSSDLGISYGIGINAPFGLEVAWPTTAVFSGAAQYGRLQAINVNPNVAIKLSDEFALAVGVSYVNMYKVDFNGTALIQEFKGDGIGFNAALLYKSDQMNFGVSYRSQVKLKSNGTSRHTASATTSANTITVTMPDMVNIGVAVHPADNLTVSVEADWVNWKKFKELAFTYNPALAGGAIPSLTVPENWKSTWAFRIGAEWAYSSTMRARLGYTYDPTPIKDVDYTPLLPGNDRQAVHLGYGIDLSDQVTVDLAYTYVWLAERNQTASTGTNIVRNGIYKSTIHLAAASATFHF